MRERVLATYRVQLRPGFGFREAADIAEHLQALGVSHLYASPVLQAAPGSEHGYDVVDPHRVSEALGGAEGYRALAAELDRRGLGQVLDIVPNHMAISGPDNPWWWDVLENGPSSRYAAYFDVDWPEGPPPSAASDAPYPPHAVLLPLLQTHYGRVLEAGGIRVERAGERFTIRVDGYQVPASPTSVGHLLGVAAGSAGPAATELAFVADGLAGLPSPAVTDGESVRRRDRDRTVLAKQLRRLLSENPDAAAAVDRAMQDLNGDVEAMDRFMSRQNFRLASWRLAAEQLGYRRFFHINELVALRGEDPEVFEDSHLRILDWLRTGVLDGVRVDHPDGLRDPEAYFRRLREAAPDAWIVAEKILEPGELLRSSWEVDGTTGYDFLNRVGGLHVDPAGEEELTDAYVRFTAESPDYDAVVRDCRARACTELLGSDLNRLTELFRTVAEGHRRHRDHLRTELLDALVEVAANFPAYRTYARAEQGEIAAEDVAITERAVAAARARREDLNPDPLGFLEDILLLRVRGRLESELVMRFQQFTGPVAAKGVEDTAFYRYNRFVALNEVGGNPSRFGTSPEAFHRASARIQARWPRTLLATSTHDTKRSEDVRARLHLLSELPAPWTRAVRRWSETNAVHRDGGLPDRNLEYLCYQTLVGAWPLGEDRLVAYLVKAAREAGAHTTWTAPDERYESAVRGFARGILRDERFVRDLDRFVAPLVEPGRVNALAQTLIRLTAPGVPDLYQGCETWDLSLVDPDNRRPVDFALRRRLLAELDGLSPEAIVARSDEGLPKLHVLREGLAVRRERPRLFGPEGTYRPLPAFGSAAEHVVAFARGEGAVTVTPRLVLGLGGQWADTSLELPAGAWVERLTGEERAGGETRIRDLLERFPVSLLLRKEGS